MSSSPSRSIGDDMVHGTYDNDDEGDDTHFLPLLGYEHTHEICEAGPALRIRSVATGRELKIKRSTGQVLLHDPVSGARKWEAVSGLTAAEAPQPKLEGWSTRRATLLLLLLLLAATTTVVAAALVSAASPDEDEHACRACVARDVLKDMASTAYKRYLA